MSLASKAALETAVNATSGRVLRPACVIAGLLLVSALSGCGVRGNLETPPEAKVSGIVTAPDAADAGGNSAVKPKPHKDFFLDGLLR